MAMVHTVVHTHQELKLSMLQMDRLMLYPISTHMQVTHASPSFLVSRHLVCRSLKPEESLFLSLGVSEL